jgi:hypothetical protein
MLFVCPPGTGSKGVLLVAANTDGCSPAKIIPGVIYLLIKEVQSGAIFFF